MVGNCAKIVLLGCSVSLYAHQIHLEVHTTEGAPLTHAQVGHPFIATVTVAQSGSLSNKPQLEGDKQFSIKHAGFALRPTHTSTFTKHTFTVYPRSSGTFTLGPAYSATDKGIQSSNTLSITVRDAPPPTTVTKRDARIFMRLHVEKEQAVVNEIITATLRFYTADASINVQQLIEPPVDAMAGYRIKQKDEPKTGTETINGNNYEYVEWKIHLIPTKPGTLILPAYGIDYAQQVQTGFAFFTFTSQSQTKRIYSNALSIAVDPLPDPTLVVGHFPSFAAQLNPTVAKLSEGITLTLTLTGSGDWSQIPLDQLIDIDPSLKWYFSKSYVSDNGTSKIAEFIIQPLAAGSYTIPAQRFTYYDTHTRKIITQSCQAQALTVISLAHVQTAGPALPTATAKSSLTNERVLNPIYHALYPRSHATMLRWPLFFVLVALLGASTLCAAARLHLVKYYHILGAWLRYRTAYKRARAAVMTARAQENYGQLYPIFKDMLRLRGLQAHEHNVSALTQIMAQPDQEAWHEFIERLYECHFYTQMPSDPQLFDQALDWLNALKKVNV